MPTSSSTALTTFASDRSVRGRRWIFRGGLLVLVLTLSTVAWFGWRQRQRDQAVREAVQLARDGFFRDAEPKLRAALERDPNNLELLRAWSRGLLGTERLNEAEAVLTRWCQVSAGDAEPYRLRMDLRHHQAQLAKPGVARQQLLQLALTDARRVLELVPEDEVTAEKVVWLCLANGQFEEADQACQRCRERQPDNPSLVYLHARVCHARGANVEAGMLLDRLLLAYPDFVPALLLRAILHYEADEAAKAIPLLRKVIAGGGESHREARYYLGLALSRAGHVEEARRVLAEVQREQFEKDTRRPGEKDSVAVRVRRAELLLGGNQAEEAMTLLQGILKEDPTCAAAHRLLANYYSERGESVKAAEHRRRAEP